MSRPSIKKRLLTLFLIIFSILFLVIGLFLYRQIESILTASVDNHLHSEIQLIAGLLEIEEDSLKMELSEVEVGEYAVALSGHYYQIVSDKGAILARSPSLSIVDAKLPAATNLLDTDYQTISGPNKTPLRILNQTYNIAGKSLTIQVGETLEETLALLRSFRKMIIIIFPASFIISIIGIVIITRLSLKKVGRFSQRVSKITEKNLNERIELDGVESELMVLAQTFNAMMERIEESFGRQRRFLSDASHDLRTPASVIKSYCDVTLMQERSAEEYKKAIETISETIKKMSRIINSIMEVARLEDETFRLNISMLDLKEVLKECVKNFEANATGSGIGITSSGDSVYLPGDREKLSNAISNIIENAVKYNRSGGSVSVDLREEDGWAVVTVADSGIGMNESDLEKIFERFYRVDRSRGKVKGTGLGLSIVKKIIELHHGIIDVKSNMGEGSCFTVRIPLKSQKN